MLIFDIFEPWLLYYKVLINSSLSMLNVFLYSCLWCMNEENYFKIISGERKKLFSVIVHYISINWALTYRKTSQTQQKSSAFSSVEMFKKPLWQTVWTQIRLLL